MVIIGFYYVIYFPKPVKFAQFTISNYKDNIKKQRKLQQQVISCELLILNPFNKESSLKESFQYYQSNKSSSKSQNFRNYNFMKQYKVRRKNWANNYTLIVHNQYMNTYFQYNIYLESPTIKHYMRMSSHQIEEPETPEIAGFISKTFQILNNEQFNKVIFWTPSGNQFTIKDTNKFQQIVLPRYFRHNKMNSFIRQLNMYGFHKTRTDHSKNIFSHPAFLRNRHDLLITIKRKIKGKIQCEIDANAEKTPKREYAEEISATLVKENPQTGLQLNTLNNISFPDLNLSNRISSEIYPKQRRDPFMNLNVSMNRLPEPEMAEALYGDDEDDDQCVSIQQKIEEGQVLKMTDIMKVNYPSLKFINPSCFFDSMKK